MFHVIEEVAFVGGAVGILVKAPTALGALDPFSLVHRARRIAELAYDPPQLQQQFTDPPQSNINRIVKQRRLPITISYCYFVMCTIPCMCILGILYSAVQCSTVQCSAVQYSAVQCSTVQYSAVHSLINAVRTLAMSLALEILSTILLAVLVSVRARTLLQIVHVLPVILGPVGELVDTLAVPLAGQVLPRVNLARCRCRSRCRCRCRSGCGLCRQRLVEVSEDNCNVRGIFLFYIIRKIQTTHTHIRTYK